MCNTLKDELKKLLKVAPDAWLITDGAAAAYITDKGKYVSYFLDAKEKVCQFILFHDKEHAKSYIKGENFKYTIKPMKVKKYCKLRGVE